MMLASMAAYTDFFITNNNNCSDKKSLRELILDVLPNTHNKTTTIRRWVGNEFFININTNTLIRTVTPPYLD